MWDAGEVIEVAAARHGLVDRRTVLKLGGTDHFIQTQLGNRTWAEAHPGVYYLNVTPMTWQCQVLAAVLAGGPGTAASHRTAALLWGLDGILGTIIEITAPYSSLPTPKGVIVHRTRRRFPATVVDSVPVTAVERTMLDLAATLPDKTVEKALMSALHKRLTTSEQIDRVIGTEGGRGVKGTRRLRRVLALTEEGVTGSVAEVEMAEIIRSAGVPLPRMQLRVRLPDGSNAYPDFSWTGLMKLVEVDGYGAHSSPDQLHHDLIRQNQLMEMGWQLRRFSARRVFQEPLVVRSELIQFLSE